MNDQEAAEAFGLKIKTKMITHETKTDEEKQRTNKFTKIRETNISMIKQSADKKEDQRKTGLRKNLLTNL